MNKNLIILLLTVLMLGSSGTKQSTPFDLHKNVGALLTGFLEKFHFRKKKIDDDLSSKAFDEYIKKVDYSKQFLLKSDIKDLSQFRRKMDDQLKSGRFLIVDASYRSYIQRVKEAENYRDEIFKKKFNFTKKESLELDPKKRDFAKNKKASKEVWRKVFKNATLNRYLSLIDEQKEELEAKNDKTKNKKKDKKKKKKDDESLIGKTDQQLKDKAHEAISKKYKKFFTRLLKESKEDFDERFYNSITAIFGPHTAYLPPKKKEDFDIDISGSLEGIGAILQEDGQYIKVMSIVPGGAAWRQKDLEVDDVIVGVKQGKEGEYVDLIDMRVDDAVRYIRGKKGTEVRLTVKKANGTRKVIPIIRDVVQVEASYTKASVLEHKDLKTKIGYIHVPKFYRDFENDSINCTDDVRAELKRLKKQKVDAVILDLRNNGGGALRDAEAMSGLFIKDGPIVQTVNSLNQVEVLKDNDSSIEYDGPLIVMINRFSASASEILAGAMKDYQRAIIVGGEHTHGKGTVQAVYPLAQGTSPLLRGFAPQLGALKLTIQKFFRINGMSTQFKGIRPDIVLPDPFGYIENKEKDLDYALPWSQVGALSYNKWTKFNYQLPELLKRSNERVSKSKQFTKIKDSVKYFLERKSDTVVSLNLKKVKAEDEKNKKITEKFKMEDENEKILVSHYEQSLLAHQDIRPGEEKQWKKDFEQRKEEWVSTLRKDTMLEEAMFIADDAIKLIKGKKLAAIGKIKKK